MVEVAPAADVAALDGGRRVGGEVVAGAAVARGGARDRGPVRAAEDDGVAGHAVVGGAEEDVRPGGVGGGRHPGEHLRPDVREVDEGDERGVDACGRVGEVGQARPEAGAHPLGPALGDDDLRAGGAGERGRLVGARAEDRDDGVETGRAQVGEGGLEEGRAVGVGPQEGLGAAHPAPGPGGEEQPGGGHGASLPPGVGGRGYGARVVHELTRRDARRVAVRAQLLSAPRPTDALGVVRHLGAVQMDLTAYVAPNADLVLWSRLGRAYSPDALDDLLESRAVVEVQGMLRPAEDVALFLAEMEAWPGREPLRDWQMWLEEWVDDNRACRDDILTRLRSEGPMPARALPDTCVRPWRSSGWTNAKNVQKLMDLLEARGEVAVSHRENGERMWDLASRVYPEVEVVPLEEAALERDRRRLAALGIARARATETQSERHDVGAAGEEAVVEGVRGRWRVDPALLDGAFQGRVAVLSPLDRLVFDRKRMAELFEFDYLLEMYKPVAKRRFGYFALPVLHGDALVGKVDAQTDAAAGTLRVHAIHWDVEPSSALREGVAREIRSLAGLLGVEVAYA